MQGRGSERGLDADWRADRQTDLHRQTSRAGSGAAAQCWGPARRLLTDAKQKDRGGTVGGRGEREWVKAEARLMEREGERRCTRGKGGRKEGETLSSQCESAGWRSFRVRLRHHRCYCKFTSLCRNHPEVLLILFNTVLITLKLVCFLLDVKESAT